MELLLLCIKIFFARILDVSLGTIRTIYTVKGKTLKSGVIAFFELIIWFLVAREALNTEIGGIWIPIAYSLGYATGTVLGIVLSKNFISSVISVEVISSKIKKNEIDAIREQGFGITALKVEDSLQIDNDQHVFFITVSSKRLNELKDLIKKLDNQAFMVINETKVVVNGFVK